MDICPRGVLRLFILIDVQLPPGLGYKMAPGLPPSSRPCEIKRPPPSILTCTLHWYDLVVMALSKASGTNAMYQAISGSNGMNIDTTMEHDSDAKPFLLLLPFLS